MSRKSDREEWDVLYQQTDVEKLPWYYKDMDPDLERELRERGITSGSFLDLCTGPGTQAVALSKKGFVVTGADISRAAIEKAKRLDAGVEFLESDMRSPSLARTYDYIFDRGCFHVLDPRDRRRYIRSVGRLLNDSGLLFLKCFSKKEPGTEGPYRFSPEEIRSIFASHFVIEKLAETYFPGPEQPGAHALFVVMRKPAR